MSHTHGPKGPNGQPERYALRVLRVDPGQAFKVRLISQRYGGVLTHWVRGRSVICQGDECPQLQHRSGMYWKGYALVEQWFADRALWFPSVLEITENLELDFRGRWERGQIWLLQRAPQIGRHKTSVFGVLMFEGQMQTVREPFDFLPVLRNLYHVQTIALDKSNPMPARIMVEPVGGLLPAPSDDKADRPATEEEWRIFTSRLKGLQFNSPEDLGKNGKPAPSESK